MYEISLKGSVLPMKRQQKRGSAVRAEQLTHSWPAPMFMHICQKIIIEPRSEKACLWGRINSVTNQDVQTR